MRAGLTLILLSALAFGTAGPLARALIDVGWTPGAIVLVRITGAAGILAVLAAAAWRTEIRRACRAPRAVRTVLFYGIVAVAGIQVCYFSTVQTLSVSVALLLEYLAPVLVVAYLWVRTARRPTNRTLVGGGIAVVGTVGVLDVTSGVAVDPVGVLWALGAAVCLASYFLLLGGAQPHLSDDRPAVDPYVLTSAGMVVGAVVVWIAALSGLLPVTVGSSTTVLAGSAVSVWLPLSALVVIATVLAYLAGAAGVSRLGATAGSLASLSEVLFAVATAWLLLGQMPTPTQLVGGVLVISGVVLTRTGRSRTRPEAAAATESRSGTPAQRSPRETTTAPT